MEAVAMHLKGDALRWYSTTILNDKDPATVPWREFEDSFLARFDQQPEDRFSRWIDYTLDSNTTVANYFQEKIQRGNDAGLSEKNQIAGLSRGMPTRYRSLLGVAGVIKTTSEWLARAQHLEYTFKDEPKSSGFKKEGFKSNSGITSLRAPTAGSKPEAGKTPISKTPSVPCQICARSGKPNQMHWHRECPNRGIPRVQTGEAEPEDQDQGNAQGSLDSSD